jgi:hypothetical protein
MKTVCETLGVARSNIAARAAGSPSRARGQCVIPERSIIAFSTAPAPWDQVVFSGSTAVSRDLGAVRSTMQDDGLLALRHRRF